MLPYWLQSLFYVLETKAYSQIEQPCSTLKPKQVSRNKQIESEESGSHFKPVLSRLVASALIDRRALMGS